MEKKKAWDIFTEIFLSVFGGVLGIGVGIIAVILISKFIFAGG